MRTIREIIRVLFANSMSYRQIGEALGISHNTVGRYDRIRLDKNFTLEQLESMDDNALESSFNARPLGCDERKPQPDFEYIHNELKIRGVTLEILWQEYRAKHPDGYSYTHVARMYVRWARKLNITMRQAHRAGEKMFVDYSGKRIPITNRETGEISMAEIYVAVMGASSKTYVEAGRSQQVEDWLLANTNALAYFGGVPSMIVPDNLKSAVLQNSKGKIKLNPQFVDFARHYGTVIIPARPKKPKDKAKVEVGVRIVQMWILAVLRNRIFYSLAEANVAIRELLEVFNSRPFKKIRGTRSELFEKIDKAALKPLPSQPYEYAEWKIHVRVGLGYIVEFSECGYMVPHSLIDQQVDIRATATTVEIFCKNRRVASYARLYTPGEQAINRECMPAAHQHYSEWSSSRLIAWGQSVGEATEKIFRHLLENKPHPEGGFRTCVALVDEGKINGLERLESAAAVALQINSPTLSSIRSIIRTGRDKTNIRLVASNSDLERPSPPVHENIRGSNYFK